MFNKNSKSSFWYISSALLIACCYLQSHPIMAHNPSNEHIPIREQKHITNPVEYMVLMQKRMNQLFERSFDDMENQLIDIQENNYPIMSSKDIKIFDTEKNYVIQLKMLGEKNHQLDIGLRGRQLTIAGQSESKSNNSYRSSHFVRSFTLPTGINPKTMKSESKANVLTISFKKFTDKQKIKKTS